MKENKKWIEGQEDWPQEKLDAWAGGNYTCTCFACGGQYQGDKRSTGCYPCVLRLREEHCQKEIKQRKQEILHQHLEMLSRERCLKDILLGFKECDSDVDVVISLIELWADSVPLQYFENTKKGVIIE